MTPAWAGAWRRAEPWCLWIAFFAIHAMQAHWNLTSGTNPFADVTVIYRGWAEQAQAGTVPGLDAPFVYPLLAILPMLTVGEMTDAVPGHLSYGAAWMLLVTAGHAIALAALAARGLPRPAGPARFRAAWWWLGFLAILGPISTGRIDAITVPIVIVALLVLRQHPALAGTLMTIGAWIKVWPAAVFAALVIGTRHRMRILAAGAGVSLAVLIGAAALGGWPHVLSFVSGQTGRGLQIEAPAALVPMWLTALGMPGYRAAYDTEILTVQVTGPGTAAIAFWTTPLMGLAVLLISALALARLRRGATFTGIVPPLALGLVMAFIVTNKVGSPQFVTWIGAVVVAGLIWDARRFRTPALLTLTIAAATCWIYPWNYPHVMTPTVTGMMVLTIRNLLELALFAWCLWRLGAPLARKRAARRTRIPA